MEPQERERLVYVQRTTMRLGTGSTSRNAESETFYEGFPQDDGTCKLVLLDMNDNLTGLIEMVNEAELNGKYERVENYFKDKKSPEEEKALKKVAQANHHLERKEYNSAEFEFDAAIRIDKRNLEANIGKGEALIGQGELGAAKEVLDKVAEFDELYDKSNKHHFNHFGMTARQAGFPDRAIEAYRKALSIDATDEGLHYNIGRALYEAGQFQEALVEVERVLRMTPQHPDALELKRHIAAKGAIHGRGG